MDTSWVGATKHARDMHASQAGRKLLLQARCCAWLVGICWCLLAALLLPPHMRLCTTAVFFSLLVLGYAPQSKHMNKAQPQVKAHGPQVKARGSQVKAHSSSQKKRKLTGAPSCSPACHSDMTCSCLGRRLFGAPSASPCSCVAKEESNDDLQPSPSPSPAPP